MNIAEVAYAITQMPDEVLDWADLAMLQSEDIWADDPEVSPPLMSVAKAISVEVTLISCGALPLIDAARRRALLVSRKPHFRV